MYNFAFVIVFDLPIECDRGNPLHNCPEFFPVLMFLVAQSSPRVYDDALDFAVGFIKKNFPFSPRCVQGLNSFSVSLMVISRPVVYGSRSSLSR